jgi:predicted acylesterase/phospholipase RssA/CRP-like cAMP-binding protein
MPVDPALARSPLFTDLEEHELEAVVERMRPREFAEGEEICHAGDPSARAWIITGGLVHWLAPTPEGGGEFVLRMRKGEVIAAQDALIGAPRSATVVASTATTAMEIDAEELIEVSRRYPQILLNVINTQRERMLRASVRRAAKQRGEEVALVAGPEIKDVLAWVAAAARSATPRPVTVLDRRLSVAGALTASDELAAESATVLILGELEPKTLGLLLEQVDRVVAFAGTAADVKLLGDFAGSGEGSLEVVLVGSEAERAHSSWPAETKRLVVRSCEREDGFPLANADLAWLARHVTRTKLGLALGAGGAKGYAHVGALGVIEDAGYTVDYIGGSSIGGFVSTQIAMGYNAEQINERFRGAFDADLVSALFSAPFGGGAAGREALTGMLKRVTEERWFSDTQIPLMIMAVDLNDRAPFPQRAGAIWEAQLAALSVAGVFPPQERNGHRLVDGIALVPVPTTSVLEDGADVVVSVNLMSAEVLERWPGLPEPEAAPAKKKGMLDTILEAMDLSQLDTSVRHAGLADVTITPRFGPADWRDFHLADLFLEAGRTAALERLPELQALSSPIDLDLARRETVLGAFV